MQTTCVLAFILLQCLENDIILNSTHTCWIPNALLICCVQDCSSVWTVTEPAFGVCFIRKLISLASLSNTSLQCRNKIQNYSFIDSFYVYSFIHLYVRVYVTWISPILVPSVHVSRKLFINTTMCYRRQLTECSACSHCIKSQTYCKTGVLYRMRCIYVSIYPCLAISL